MAGRGGGHGEGATKRPAPVRQWAQGQAVLWPSDRHGPAPAGRAVCPEAIKTLRQTAELEVTIAADEMVDLPAVDLSLHVRLPGVFTPAVQRALQAPDDDENEFERALGGVVDLVDTADRRTTLARAVVALRDQGGISSALAASAVFNPGPGALGPVLLGGGRVPRRPGRRPDGAGRRPRRRRL